MSTVAQTNVATSTKVVQVRGVSKVFKRDAFQVTALDDVSIDIAKGEFLALMGPSGSGKTTLLNMIAAIDRPSSGELLVQGQDIFRFNDGQIARWRNEHIGYVFQTFNLIPVLTAFENVELPLLLTKLTSQQRRDHVMTALKLVGLEDRVGHLPKQLSGGQEQRVAIARAIVSDPTLLLADEPTGDLDSNSATDVLEILKRLNEDFHKTIVMVTHDPHAASYAHVTRHLEKGMLLRVRKGKAGDKGADSLAVDNFDNDYDVAAWKEGAFYFKDASFGEIAFEIGNRYNVGLVNKSKKQLWSYTGLFRSESLQEVIETICQTENLAYRFNNGNLEIIDK